MKNKKALVAFLAISLTSLSIGQTRTLEDLSYIREKTTLQDVKGLRQTISKCEWESDPYHVKNMEKFVEVGKSASAGNAKDQFLLGLCYLDGKVSGGDDVEGFKWILRSAEQGYAPAQNAVGTCYQNGEGVEANEDEAKAWWLKAADGGDPRAQWIVGWMHTQNPEEAVKSWEAAAKQGLYEAHCDLATAYFWGVGVKYDLAEAFKWISIAMVSGANRNPDFVEPDPGMGPGLHHFRRGWINHNDPKEGFYLMHRAITTNAAVTKEVRAEGERRALEFARNHIVKIDKPQSRAEFTQSVNWNAAATKANTGWEKAKGNISAYGQERREMFYEYVRGEVVPQNHIMAYKCLSVAIVTTGHPNSIRDLDALTLQMTTDEIVTAQKLSQKWVDELELQWNSPQIAELRKESEAGDPHAQRMLAGFYFTGKNSVLRNYEKGLLWLRKAAEQGEAGAQYDLGMCYLHGVRGVEHNEETARELFLKSAQGGYSRGQYEMGIREGGGVDNEWLREAALQGNYNAQVAIGMDYLYNHSNKIKAHKWLNLTNRTSPRFLEKRGSRARGNNLTQAIEDHLSHYFEVEQLISDDERHTAMKEGIDLKISPSVESKRLLDHLITKRKEGSTSAKIYLEKDFAFLAGEHEFTALLYQFAELGNIAAQTEIGTGYMEGRDGYQHNIFLGLKWITLARKNGTDLRDSYRVLFEEMVKHVNNGVLPDTTLHLSGKSRLNSSMTTPPPTRSQEWIDREIETYPKGVSEVAKKLADEWKPFRF